MHFKSSNYVHKRSSLKGRQQDIQKAGYQAFGFRVNLQGGWERKYLRCSNRSRKRIKMIKIEIEEGEDLKKEDYQQCQVSQQGMEKNKRLRNHSIGCGLEDILQWRKKKKKKKPNTFLSYLVQINRL